MKKNTELYCYEALLEVGKRVYKYDRLFNRASDSTLEIAVSIKCQDSADSETFFFNGVDYIPFRGQDNYATEFAFELHNQILNSKNKQVRYFIDSDARITIEKERFNMTNNFTADETNVGTLEIELSFDC